MNLFKKIGISGMAFIIISCGAKTRDKEEDQREVKDEKQSEEILNSVSEPEPETEPTPSNPSKDEMGNLVYAPPFSFEAFYQWTKTEFDRETETYVKRPSHLLTFKIKMDKNGRFTGTETDIHLRFGDYYFMYEKPDTISNKTIEISGKWNDSFISMGEGYLKCYSLESAAFDDWSLFLLGNCEYAWYSDAPRLDAMEWATTKAMTISNVKVL